MFVIARVASAIARGTIGTRPLARRGKLRARGLELRGALGGRGAGAALN
jgi:hypothetical protein